jgi:hypothetical protein
MEMIGHEHIGVYTDAENLKRTPESIQKARPIVIVAEDHVPGHCPGKLPDKALGYELLNGRRAIIEEAN